MDSRSLRKSLVALVIVASATNDRAAMVPYFVEVLDNLPSKGLARLTMLMNIITDRRYEVDEVLNNIRDTIVNNRRLSTPTLVAVITGYLTMRYNI